MIGNTQSILANRIPSTRSHVRDSNFDIKTNFIFLFFFFVLAIKKKAYKMLKGFALLMTAFCGLVHAVSQQVHYKTPLGIDYQGYTIIN